MLRGTETIASSSTASARNSVAYAGGKRLRESLGSPESSVTHSWDRLVASLVSNVGSPPILTSATVMLAAFKIPGLRTWIWGVVYVSLGVLIPFLYVVWSFMRGQITDIDVRLREQRRRPLLVTLICTGIGWLVLALGAAPAGMTTVAAAMWLQVAAIFFVTLRWKISVHTAAAAGGATLIWTLLGSGIPFLLVVPLIVWSRIRLRHHTLPQTLAGALIGFIVFFAVTTLAPIR